MKSDNELIAEFLEFVQKSYTKDSEKLWCDNKHGLPVGELKFDTSWDWLMPVVHKILKTTEPLPGQGWSYEYLNLEKTRIGNSIEYVYELVVRFIKWYNETYAGSVPA